ncbi:hypothetical protein [Olleya sp. Bg11-27]|uniref:hypothetical protein n=1 Tax=Olleya sp. Bg11-27 TaxID=2058135 RepID=UPI0012FD646D|nr:hypothetical protein [Olleya sp. Bg11-27]
MTLNKKQIVFFLFYMSVLSGIAQQKTIYYGVPGTGGAAVCVFEDNTYKIIKNETSFSTLENKYIVFKTPEIDQSRFTVISNSEQKTDSITISVSVYDIISSADNTYIGYKQNANDDYTYVNLIIESRLFNTTSNSKTYQLKIPKSNYLQLVYEEEYINLSYLESFKLPKNTSNLFFDFKYNYNKKSNLNLFAEIDGAGKLKVNKRLFSTDNPKGDYVKKTATDSIKNWTVPLKVEQEAYKKFDNPKLSYQPVLNISPTTYDDHFPKIESLDAALELVQADDSKILLIFNQLLDNNAQAYFEEFARGLNNYSRGDYDAHLKNIIVYLSKPEDRKALVKFNSENANEVIAINSHLETLYTEQIWSNRFRNKYGLSLSTLELDKKLINLNAVHVIDKKIKAKITSAKDFLNLNQIEDKDFLFKNLTGEHESVTEVTEVSERYSSNKERNRKTTAQFYWKSIAAVQLKDELTRLTIKHKTDKVLDSVYANLAINYVSYDYNFNDFIGYESFSKSKIYFEFSLYLSRFATQIAQIKVRYSNYDNNIYAIGFGLNKKGALQYPELVIPTYENIMLLKGFNSQFIGNYLNYLILNNTSPYDAFDSFYKSIISKQGNYKNQIEQYYNSYLLSPDEMYPHNEINRLSDQLSEASNTVAWQVVTKQNTDKQLLKRALDWSKLSLEIEPENHYYMDTYAHLLYFTGSLEKAIQMESEAITLATDNKDDEALKGYTETLQKIKSGTLK